MTSDELRARELSWKRRLDAGELEFSATAFDQLAAALSSAPPPGEDAGGFMDPATFAPMTQAEYLRALERT